MGSLWTGVTGLKTYSSAISVVADNLANTNTTGFKSSRALFSDLMSSSTDGIADTEVGNGSTIGSISLTTGTGGYETTSSSTDMAISGEDGYFQVEDAVNNKTYYTRDGSFSFDSNGYLVTSEGLQVQGWAVDSDAIAAAEAAGTTLSTVPTTGDQTSIQIKDFTLDPQATSEITLDTNLDSDTETGTTDATDPYFTMFKDYDATSDTPAADADYSTSLTVYDAEGAQHDLTVYYNKVSAEDGKEYWEYMVSMDPSEDGNSTTAGTSKAGVLMIGTLTFGSDGTLQNQTAYTLSSNATDATDLSSWTQSSLSGSGEPQLAATFLSSSSGSALSSQTIACSLGLKSTSASWSSDAASTAAGIGSNAALNAGIATSDVSRASTSTTNYATSSYTITSSVDGYASGQLSSTSVDNDGVISGTFSNGQTRPLWVLSLANFTNPSGLTSEGDNLYSAGTDSGTMTIGRANTGDFDSVVGNTLESSNVDLATEMVNLIQYQRAFESNSKVVTTSDSVIETTLGIKK